MNVLCLRARIGLILKVPTIFSVGVFRRIVHRNKYFIEIPSVVSEKVIHGIWFYVGINILFFLSQSNQSLCRIWRGRLRSSKVLNRKRYLWFGAPFSKRAFWYPPSVRFRVISRHFKYVLNCLKQSYIRGCHYCLGERERELLHSSSIAGALSPKLLQFWASWGSNGLTLS